MSEDKQTPVGIDGVRNFVTWNFLTRIADMKDRSNQIQWFIESVEPGPNDDADQDPAYLIRELLHRIDSRMACTIYYLMVANNRLSVTCSSCAASLKGIVALALVAVVDGPEERQSLPGSICLIRLLTIGI